MEFKKLCELDAPAVEKKAIADKICMELTVLPAIEEQIFYPAARDAINDDDLLNKAEVEHAGAKDLIAQISAMDVKGELFNAKVIVLGESIDHHVDKERYEIFSKARQSGMGLKGMVDDLTALKENLLANDQTTA